MFWILITILALIMLMISIPYSVYVYRHMEAQPVVVKPTFDEDEVVKRLLKTRTIKRCYRWM